MNVHDINFGNHRPDKLRNASVEKAGKKGMEEAVPKETPDVKPASSRDRVEISDAARAASSEQDDLKQEIQFARRAMYSIPPLSPERAEEILRRLKQGDYNAPDVLAQLAERLSEDIQSLPPEEETRPLPPEVEGNGTAAE